MLSAYGCLAIASTALEVAIPIPIPAPIPVRTAIAAPIATNVDIIFSSSIDKIMIFLNLISVYPDYSIASLINSDVKNTNTYA